MIKLLPKRFDKIWGSELWLAADLPIFSNMKEVGSYPLLVKVIDAQAVLSVQVHPDDKMSQALCGGDNGKSECWYILDAKEGASIFAGLVAGATKKDLETALTLGGVESILNKVSVHKGDFVYIGAGMAHALGAGVKVLEVQQSSDTTYRLFDWGRGRALDIEKALKCVKEELLGDVRPFASMARSEGAVGGKIESKSEGEIGSKLESVAGSGEGSLKGDAGSGEGETKNEAEGKVETRIESKIVRKAEDKAKSNIGSGLGGETGSELESAAGSKAESKIEGKIGNKAESSIKSNIESKIKSEAEGDTESKIKNNLFEATLFYGDGEFACPYFSLEALDINGGYSAIARWTLLFFVIAGRGEVKGEGAKFALDKEDTLCVKAGEKVTISGHLKVMRIEATGE